MRIIGPPSATRDLDGRLIEMGATPLFRDHMFPALWDAAVEYGIDPVGVVAQSFKETGGGTFKGKVKPEHYNTAGIKVRHLGYGGPSTLGDEQLAHAAFASWQVGARAHAEHLRAYAGWPVEGLVVDPRYGLALKGPGSWCETFEELGGKWAPSPTYGAELVGIARRLQGASL